MSNSDNIIRIDFGGNATSADGQLPPATPADSAETAPTNIVTGSFRATPVHQTITRSRFAGLDFSRELLRAAVIRLGERIKELTENRFDAQKFLELKEDDEMGILNSDPAREPLRTIKAEAIKHLAASLSPTCAFL